MTVRKNSSNTRRKYGEQMYLRRGTIIRGWADWVAGRSDELIQTMNLEIDFLLRSKEEIEITFLLGILADLQIKSEKFEDAHSSLNKALHFANSNQEKFYLSEIYRLKAKLAEIDPAKFSSPEKPTIFLWRARLPNRNTPKPGLTA